MDHDDAQAVRLFFFQAEDGIRDYKVTGVQTCALPIYPHDQEGHRPDRKRRRVGRSRGSRKRAYQPGPRFRFEDFWLPQAERPRAKDKRFRDRSAERWIHANSDHEAGRITSEDASRPKTCGVRDEPNRKQSIITSMAAVRFWHKATGWLKTPIR